MGKKKDVYTGKKKEPLGFYMKKKWQLYLMLLVPLIFLAIFNYAPMYGVVIAFKNYRIAEGIFGSPWAKSYGMENFIRFFSNYNFRECLRNTVVLSVYSLIVTLPCSVVFALGLNYVRSRKFQKTVQLISYSPYFISTVVFVSILNMLFDTKAGALGKFFYEMSGVNVLGTASYFPSLCVWSGVWQGLGFGAIIYIAALAGVDLQLHEAAIIDGATVLQRIRYVDIPCILPTAVIMLILNMGSILGLGYEKVYAMQNQNNIGVSEIISTYSYKVALASSFPDFSYATAIGLFQSVVGLALILVTNKIAEKITGYGFM